MSDQSAEIRITTNHALPKTLERIIAQIDEQKRVVLSGVGRHMGTTFVYAHATQLRVPNAAFFTEIDLLTFTPRDSEHDVTAPRLRVTITTDPTVAEKQKSAFNAALPADAIVPRDTPLPALPRRARGDAAAPKNDDDAGTSDPAPSNKNERSNSSQPTTAKDKDTDAAARRKPRRRGGAKKSSDAAVAVAAE